MNDGREGIKSHPFFACLDWNAVLHKQVKVPFIPHVDGPLDYKYFDRMIPAVGSASLNNMQSMIVESVCSPQQPPTEMELQLRIRHEQERQAMENPRNHKRTRTPSTELDTRYIGFEYSCD